MNKDDLLLLEKMLSIRARIRAGEYRFTVHALERRIERSIDKTEIEEAILKWRNY